MRTGIFALCAALLAANAAAASVDLDRARAIHEAALTLDAHADIELPEAPSRYANADGSSKVAPDKMRKGGLDAVVLSAAVGPGPRNAAGYAAARATAERELEAVRELAADPASQAVIAGSPAELRTAHENGERAFILGMQNALILGTEPAAVDMLFEAGVRVFGLTHMGHNDFADSSRPLFIGELGHHEPTAEHSGLSALGREAVRRVNALGGIVDISQLSREAALQVIEQSKAPVIASHSNVRALCNVSRNLSDAEIDQIGATGGVIHIAPFRGYLFDTTDPGLDLAIRAERRKADLPEDYLYPFELYWELDDPEKQAAFTSAISDLLGPGSMEDMLNHIDYVAKRIGVDHVGIGTDFNHGSAIVGFHDASDALNVTVALLERGYSEADIHKIWGGNFLRVWRAAEAAAAPR